MTSKTGLSILTFCAATAALAHEGVKNPDVMARMEGMKQIGAEMKVIGEMAKGAVPFNADAARAAAGEIARHAAEVPALFETRADDPKSEARPAIWEDFADFTAKSKELETIAAGLASGLTEKSDLSLAITSLGNNCKSCHETYRD